MACLTALGNEILAMIIDLVHDTSPATIPALFHTCLRLRPFAQYSQYRSLTLCGTSTTCMEAKLRRIASQDLLPAIRHLHVPGSAPLPPSLAELLPRMTGLTSLTIARPRVPRSILDALPARARLRARIEAGPWFGEAEDENAVTLQGCANLHALDVEVEYTRAEPCQGFMSQVKRVLLSCENLRELQLDVHKLTDAYGMPYPPLREYCGLGFGEGERMPALEELIVEEYPFGREDRSRESSVEEDEQEEGDDDDDDDDYDDGYGAFYEANVVGYPIPGKEIDFWATTFDWSRLRYLRTSYPSLALKMAPYLKALREVEFSGENNYRVKDMHAFFAQVASPGLTHVLVPRISHLGLPSSRLAHHGPTLQSLHIHPPNEWSRRPWRLSAATEPFVRMLGSSAPHLESLSLPIPRSAATGWPQPLLDALADTALFPRLRDLTLFCELGVKDRKQPVKPYVTYAAARAIFAGLLEAGSGLRRLRLVSGDPDDPGFGLVTASDFWPVYNSTSFECVTEDNEAGKERKFTVCCERLSGSRNAMLRRVVETGEDPVPLLLKAKMEKKRKRGSGGGSEEEREDKGDSSDEVCEIWGPRYYQRDRKEEGMPEHFKVAFEGPTPVDDSDDDY
ncbi:hypothetical protein F4810DRAFT_664417 [Camillea tinctor]|nr:hypothetical protein F4810DRAFT_664417 [Camillea tinctor]